MSWFQMLKTFLIRLYASSLALSIGGLLFSVVREVFASVDPVHHDAGVNTNEGIRKCTDLLVGQYLCGDVDIDPDTQQARGCSEELQEVPVWCTTAPGVVCDGQFTNGSFQHAVPCKWTNGHSFETALLLSVFLGMFGVDRFYLGYPAIGLVKFATLGFMFLGQLIDILLIATQVVTPSDGSAYVLDYYGAAMTRIVRDNNTYLQPGD